MENLQALKLKIIATNLCDLNGGMLFIVFIIIAGNMRICWGRLARQSHSKHLPQYKLDSSKLKEKNKFNKNVTAADAAVVAACGRQCWLWGRQLHS